MIYVTLKGRTRAKGPGNKREALSCQQADDLPSLELLQAEPERSFLRDVVKRVPALGENLTSLCNSKPCDF